MKTSIAITLIVTGVLLVMTPALSDYWYQRNVVALLSQPAVNRVTLEGKMEDTYRLGCWFTGSAMVGVAVLCSISRKRGVPEESLTATAV